jgi:hypothetical protein
MYREAVLDSLIVGLRPVLFDVVDPASDEIRDTSHDLGLCAPEPGFDAGQVRVADTGGGGESAQAVAAEFALLPDF